MRNSTVESTDNGVSPSVPDWNREQVIPRAFEPSKRLLRTLRQHEEHRQISNPFLKRVLMRLTVMRHMAWSCICGADIPFNENLQGGLVMPHPNGIVIHPEAHVGPNCKIYQQVTLGIGPKPGLPKLGGNIIIGAGAKLLGGISIGDNVMIGANAVVVDDVPPNTTAVGIPAQTIPHSRTGGAQ